jgi:large subunit ribosomal protein L10
MEIDALKDTFGGVRDMVLLTATGIDATADNQIRLGLRKKNIRLQVVKNSLARRVFSELDMPLQGCWEGPTLVAWGAGSLAELSRELDGLLRKNKKFQAKIALSEGVALPFDRAKTMPTRVEALGRVAALAMAPAGRVASQLRGAGGRIAGQVKTLAERPAEPAPA